MTDNTPQTDLDRIFQEPAFLMQVECQAEWRAEKAEQYPGDERNQPAADGLRELAAWIKANPTSPLLVRLNNALDRF